jgi:LEA14-like dessication related protein
MRNRYIFLLISFVLFFACKKPISPVYKDLRNFQIGKIAGDTSLVTFEVVYYNPNTFDLQFKRAHCDVFIEQNYAGHFDIDTFMLIKKQADFVLPVTMQVGMKNFLKNAMQFMFKSELEVQVKGKARVGRRGFYINVPVDYTGKHKISLF